MTEGTESVRPRKAPSRRKRVEPESGDKSGEPSKSASSKTASRKSIPPKSTLSKSKSRRSTVPESITSESIASELLTSESLTSESNVPKSRKLVQSFPPEDSDELDSPYPQLDPALELDLPRFDVREMPADLRELGLKLSEEGGAVEITEDEIISSRAGRLRPEPKRYDVCFDEGRIDSDAARVVRRLTRAGFEAYLVGGCVRDLLLNRRPKDFDVATDASPDDVRRLFRNSRIIGRRFRLVHVLFGGGKVIETATFRRAPPQDEERDGAELLIRNDNEFGEAHEDALRRDFTVNGLFYDLDAGQVLDWVEGMPDVERRTINTIGDPVIRFQEDPIRMLRAIKFASRLDCGVAPIVYDAIVQCRGSLAMAARPRLFEELLRLMRGGAAHRSVYLAWELGVLDVLVPELASFLSDQPEDGGLIWRILQVVDARTRERGEPLSDLVLCSALLLEPMLEACDNARDRMRMAGEFLEPLIDRLNVPRRIADAMRRIVALLPRLESGRGGRFQRTALFVDASIVQEIRRDARQLPRQVEERGLGESTREAGVSPARTRRRRRGRTSYSVSEPATES